jgi:hypothetical protein
VPAEAFGDGFFDAEDVEAEGVGELGAEVAIDAPADACVEVVFGVDFVLGAGADGVEDLDGGEGCFGDDGC